jgi:hypothetical protein
MMGGLTRQSRHLPIENPSRKRGVFFFKQARRGSTAKDGCPISARFWQKWGSSHCQRYTDTVYSLQKGCTYSSWLLGRMEQFQPSLFHNKIHVHVTHNLYSEMQNAPH